MLEFTSVLKCELVESLANDLQVVNSARVSFNEEHAAMSEADAGLVSYLLKNKHGTPFEHSFFKFRLEVPIFEVREHHRHRVGHSYNEWSGRYSELESKFYVPEAARERVGKPGHYVYKEKDTNARESVLLRTLLTEQYSACWGAYQTLIANGIALEQARMVLPVGIFSKFIWTCNARSLMHFINLRAEPTAQKEIRMVAEQAELALEKHMPITYAAFVANGRVAP